MKKLLSLLLALLLLVSIVYCPSASAAINYCGAFEDAINLLRWHSPYWDIEEGDSFPVSSIINYTKQQLCCDAYGEEPITEGSYTYYARYAIPADVFETAAMDFFAVVDVNALRNYTSFFWDPITFTGIDDFQNYQEDRGVYLFSNSGGMGDPSWYEVLGYAEENGRYRVYSRFVSQLWGQPEGVEGVDYIQIGGDFFAVEHYLETVMAISNGRVQFHSWDEISQPPDKELTKPLTVVVQQEDVTIEGPTDAFPGDTSIEITLAEEATVDSVQAALGDLAADFVAYSISATADPNVTLQVTFAVPQSFDMAKIALFSFSEDGTTTRLQVFFNTDEATITAEVDHLGLFAVVELATADPQPGDVNGDGKMNARDARIILQYLAGLITEEDLSLMLADFNDDGIVNARDARAILRQIAGLL